MSAEINLTPSDVVGAVQRALMELSAYMNRPALSIDVVACEAHLDHIYKMLRTLQDMQIQAGAMAGAGNENGAEARKN